MRRSPAICVLHDSSSNSGSTSRPRNNRSRRRCSTPTTSSSSSNYSPVLPRCRRDSAMKPMTSAEFDALLLQDFYAFAQRCFLELYSYPLEWNWHHEVIAAKLVGCHKGKITRLALCKPARHLGKTEKAKRSALTHCAFASTGTGIFSREVCGGPG